jgi:predicted Zn-dependent peptidase
MSGGPPSQWPQSVATVPLAHGCYYGLRAAVPSIATLTGTFRTGTALAPGDAVLQRLVAALVGCANRRRGPVEIAELLEARGASFAVEADADGVRFFARACTTDLPQLVDWTMECLREPEFDQILFDAERARLIADLQYRATDPAHIATSALTRMLYPPPHPAYEPGPAEQAALLEGFTIDDVRRFHRERYGANDLRVAVVGDVDPQAAARLVERGVKGWAPRDVPEAVQWGEAAPVPDGQRLVLPEQESYGVAMGQRLALARTHPDYPALRLTNRILGGAFSSRLVASVRDQQGLTYLIRSELGETRHGGGHWQVALSASPDKLEAALAATRTIIERLAQAGVEAREFENAKRAAIGTYHIGLATLDGLSDAILSAADLGWEPDDLLGFERRTEAVTLAQIDRVIGDCLRPQDWRTCIAGPAEID